MEFSASGPIVYAPELKHSAFVEPMGYACADFAMAAHRQVDENAVLLNVLSIEDKISGVLLDVYGVIRTGDGVLPGTSETMKSLVSSGKKVGILTNSTQLSAKEIEKFASYKLFPGEHFHFLISSGEVARSVFLAEALPNDTFPFETPRKTYWLLGNPHPKFVSHEGIFKDTGYQQVKDIKDADFIYISIPNKNGDDRTNPEDFRDEVEAIKDSNLPVYCPNPDKFAHEGNPPKQVVRQGSIAKMCEEAGMKVFYVGKPYQKVYSVALEKFKEMGLNNPNEILMVGDTPETDIRGAKECGMKTALVTKTGIMGDRVLDEGFAKAIGDLPENDVPDYLIQRLGSR